MKVNGFIIDLAMPVLIACLKHEYPYELWYLFRGRDASKRISALLNP